MKMDVYLHIFVLKSVTAVCVNIVIPAFHQKQFKVSATLSHNNTIA